MKRKVFSILCLILLLLVYSSITINAVYNIDITNGQGPVVNITQSNGTAYTDGGTGEFIAKYKTMAIFLGGLGTISMVGAMLFNISRLNVTMGNPMQRQQCLRGILVCGIFAALLGSSTLFIGLFYGVLH